MHDIVNYLVLHRHLGIYMYADSEDGIFGKVNFFIVFLQFKTNVFGVVFGVVVMLRTAYANTFTVEAIFEALISVWHDPLVSRWQEKLL